MSPPFEPDPCPEHARVTSYTPHNVHRACVFLFVFWRELEHSCAREMVNADQAIHYLLRRNDYQNNSLNIFSCNCPGAITGFSCRAPENNSPKIVSCMGPCPVRAPPVIAPGALTGFSCRAPENNSKIIFPACNHFESEGSCSRGHLHGGGWGLLFSQYKFFTSIPSANLANCSHNNRLVIFAGDPQNRRKLGAIQQQVAAAARFRGCSDHRALR